MSQKAEAVARVGMPIKSATVEAVIIRADGTREPLGVVSYYHRNPLRRWAWKAMRFLRKA